MNNKQTLINTQSMQPNIHSAQESSSQRQIYIKIFESKYQGISLMLEDVTLYPTQMLKNISTYVKHGIAANQCTPAVKNIYLQLQTDFQLYHSKLTNIKDIIEQESFQKESIFEESHQTAIKQSAEQKQEKQQNLINENITNQERKRKPIGMEALKKLMNQFSQKDEVHVSPTLVQKAKIISAWKVKQIQVKLEPLKQSFKRREHLSPNNYMKKIEPERINSPRTINIITGNRLSLADKEMRKLLISKAKSNNFIKDEDELEDSQKIESQINFALNRLTSQYFEHFYELLEPFSLKNHSSSILTKKIISKSCQEHNFIDIYTRLTKKLSSLSREVFEVSLHEEANMFKFIFIESIQQYFYQMVEQEVQPEKEEDYKKKIQGLCMFIGKLIKEKVLKKRSFGYIFNSLIKRYIYLYKHNHTNSNLHELYVQCIFKVIQNSAEKYQSILQKVQLSNPHIQSITKKLLSDQHSDSVEEEIPYCDYTALIELLNKQLPSQRLKIKFLIQDYRCKKVTSSPNQTIQQVLQLADNIYANRENIHKIANYQKPNVLVKEYLRRFAEGTKQKVQENVQVFPVLLENKQFQCNFLKILKKIIGELCSMECDLPYLNSSLGRVIYMYCQSTGKQWENLNLESQDEDIREFLGNVEVKYNSLAYED